MTEDNSPPGLLAAPWRIFFVLAAVHAMLGPPLSLWFGLDPARHGAGMVLGMGLAAVAGYALTALPGWDGAGPVSGRVSGLLAALWCLAAAGAGLHLPLLVWPFPLALVAVLLRRRQGDAKRLAVCAATVGVTATMLVLGPSDAMTILAALICFIGGRAVPAFLSSAAGRPAPVPGAAPAVAAMLTLASMFWVNAGIAAAVAVSWQTQHWPRRAFSGRAGAMLAIAWLMLAAGLALRGAAAYLPAFQIAGTHLLSMGALGGMVVAISGRAGMRRVNGCPIAGGAILASFALVEAAALLRLAAMAQPALVHLAALAWSAGWLAYLLALRPVLSGPPPRPAFSGRRPDVPV